ncbi:putative acetyltransferase [Allopseudospirillum japonicum]|uniref:Putative acetyltransferase n=1 Tax=Allopseudospirillum japonicum TaxID=64971 RepID=A0A1H6SES1_9GAMM|nr:GNAT family N-acetyltransferase [Allopseudospirillum japonicum]SEI65346.1 putative acetyltransferase [Allopseudospirillum japonicum]
MLNIQKYTQNNIQDIIEVFYQAIYTIDASLYTDAQKRAWAPLPVDDTFWLQRLARKKPLVAQFSDKIVGFIELDIDGHIDCLYVHPQWQRQGVASALYTHLLEEAKRKQIQSLYVEASLAARPFFKKHGFKLIKANKIYRKGEILESFSMELIL